MSKLTKTMVLCCLHVGLEHDCSSPRNHFKVLQTHERFRKNFSGIRWKKNEIWRKKNISTRPQLSMDQLKFKRTIIVMSCLKDSRSDMNFHVVCNGGLLQEATRRDTCHIKWAEISICTLVFFKIIIFPRHNRTKFVAMYNIVYGSLPQVAICKKI